VYYTARRKSDRRSYLGVATSRDPANGFTDHGCLLEWTTEAIDAFVIEDAGKRYLTWKAYGLDKGKAIQILGRELTADGLGVTGEVFTLLTAEASGWEAGGVEGQALFKRGRYFYMTYSGNACCGTSCNYQVGLARSSTLGGPWEKYAGNPVLRGDQAWKCPGHGTVVTTADNRYFYLHHAYSATDFTFTGRQGLLSELVWNEQTGWPAFRYGTAPPVQAESPVGAPQQLEPGLSTHFAGDDAPLPWVWDVSQPEPRFGTGGGGLQVSASHTGQPAGSFLGLVVKKGTYTFSATITPRDQVLQSVCVYGDAHNAMGLGAGKDSLELWQVKEGNRQVLRKVPLPPGSQAITLRVRGRPGGSYEFGWGPGAAAEQPLSQPTLDGAFLPRWDRAPRVGISVRGKPDARGMVRSVRLQYE
jgi:beta-xylosidase